MCYHNCQNSKEAGEIKFSISMHIIYSIYLFVCLSLVSEFKNNCEMSLVGWALCGIIGTAASYVIYKFIAEKTTELVTSDLWQLNLYDKKISCHSISGGTFTFLIAFVVQKLIHLFDPTAINGSLATICCSICTISTLGFDCSSRE